MKATDNFKHTIQEYLDVRAKTDELFAKAYAKPNKSIDECITYILNEVQRSGCNGFDDDEIYGMAVHYYDEDNLDAGKKINCKVVVNHVVELTEKEKQEQYERLYCCNPFNPDWFEGMTQADLFNLKEI